MQSQIKLTAKFKIIIFAPYVIVNYASNVADCTSHHTDKELCKEDLFLDTCIFLNTRALLCSYVL